MGVERLVDGDVPKIMKNREEEGKYKKWKEVERGRGNTLHYFYFSDSCVLSYVLGKSVYCDKRTYV